MVGSYIASWSVYFWLSVGEDWGRAEKRCEQAELRALLLSFVYCKFRFELKRKLKLVVKQMNLPLSDIKPDAIGIFTTSRFGGLLMVIQIVILNWLYQISKKIRDTVLN